MIAPPFERVFDLNRLSEAGEEFMLEANSAELAALASWAGVDAVARFVARIELSRKAINRFLYEAKLEADLTQTCGVTLEPVVSHLDRIFTRELLLTRQGRHAALLESEPLAPADDDGPEEISSPHFDLAGPALEEFTLAIDPYPRAPGVAFDSAGDEAGTPDNPFSVLKRLKTSP